MNAPAAAAQESGIMLITRLAMVSPLQLPGEGAAPAVASCRAGCVCVPLLQLQGAEEQRRDQPCCHVQRAGLGQQVRTWLAGGGAAQWVASLAGWLASRLTGVPHLRMPNGQGF